MSKAEIDKKYLKEHAELSKKYYKDKALSKEDFDKLHGELWERHNAELIAKGFRVERKLEAKNP